MKKIVRLISLATVLASVTWLSTGQALATILCESSCFLHEEGIEATCYDPLTGRSPCTCRHGVWVCGV